MAAIANTFTTFSAIGNREDLIDKIFMISPKDTPFFSAVGSAKAGATYHEWQTDSLAAVDTSNAQIEGDDITSFSAAAPTSRPGNRTQILRKTLIVSNTQDAVQKAGRKKEMVWQMMKRQAEIRRDAEAIVVGNQAVVAGGSGAARKLRSLDSWYATNTSRGTGGANGSATDTTGAATDGTQRALTESLVKSMIQAAYTQGGDIDTIMAGPFNKTVISAFTGNNTRMQDTSDKKLVAAIDLYVSDFGTHKVLPNRFQRDRDLHLLDTDLWAIATLRPLKPIDLATTGDAQKGALIWEFTLEARNEAGSAIVADLTTS
jgi:hypothetical protein